MLWKNKWHDWNLQDTSTKIIVVDILSLTGTKESITDDIFGHPEVAPERYSDGRSQL